MDSYQVAVERLFSAVRSQDLNTLKDVLPSISNINITEKNFQDETALILASMFPSVAIVEELLRHKPNIHRCDRSGQTALHWATSTGNLNVVRVLLDANANVNVYDHSGKSPILHAVTCGYEEIVQLLIAADVNVDDYEKAMAYGKIF